MSFRGITIELMGETMQRLFTRVFTILAKPEVKTVRAEELPRDSPSSEIYSGAVSN